MAIANEPLLSTFYTPLEPPEEPGDGAHPSQTLHKELLPGASAMAAPSSAKLHPPHSDSSSLTYTSVCHACKGKSSSSSSSNSHVYQLTTCKHGFCKPCLASFAAERLLPPLQTANLPPDLDAAAISCPLEGCPCILSRQDLRFAIGPGILHLLDQKIASMVTLKLIFPLLRLCPQCKSDSPQRLLLPHTHLSSLPCDSLWTALQSNGLHVDPCKFTQAEDLVLLLQEAAPASFLCPHCFLFICQDCAANLGPFDENAVPKHECAPSPARCSVDFTRAMLRLCSAYAQSTLYTPKNRASKKSKANSFSWLVSRLTCSLTKNVIQSKPKSTTDLIYDGCLAKRFKGAMDATEEIINGADVKAQAHGSIEKRVGFPGFKVKSYIRRRARTAAEMRHRHVQVQDMQAQTALQELVNCLTPMLKAPDRSALPPMVVAFLCSHDLPYTLLKWLVRNDSLMDIIAREHLYCSLLAFLKVLSSSWDLLPLLCRSDAEHHDCWGAAAPRWETPGSLISDLGKISKQAQFMLRLVKPELMGRGTVRLVQDIEATYGQICQRIKAWDAAILGHPWSDDGGPVADTSEPHQKQQLLINQLNSLIPYANISVPESSSQVSQELIDFYKTALRPLQFDEGDLLSSHYFRNYVKKSAQGMALNKQRALAISKQMMDLNTALPLEWNSSIFVRVDEQHSDLLRALIIGPEGTPYENGVFLFDLWLGAKYPEEPPHVQFLTTGGGKVRFNPNLYKSGKVCLSILGTWLGPGWKPGQSSILQVLVSLQALVFVENPFYNEPGAFTMQGVDAKVYKKNQRHNTLWYSMLPALRSPDPLFKPIIQTHFRLKAGNILHQCTVWIEEESRRNVKQSLISSQQQIQLQLQQLSSSARS